MTGKRPIFEVDFRGRSFRDKISGQLPTTNYLPLAVQSKGVGIQSLSTTAQGTYYPNLDLGTGDFAVMLWAQASLWTGSRTYLVQEGVGGASFWYAPDVESSGSVRIYAQDATGMIFNGTLAWGATNSLAELGNQPVFICINVKRGVEVSGYVNQYPAYVSLATDAMRALPVNNLTLNTWNGNKNVTMFRTTIYDGTLTDAEMQQEYLEFLNAPGPIVSPTTLKPRIEVDPKGTILSYDFQQYRGGTTVLDASGNGNHGSVVYGQSTVDGLTVEDPKTGYVGGIRTDIGINPPAFTIEALVRADSSINLPYMAIGGGYASGVRIFSSAGTSVRCQVGNGTAPITIIHVLNSTNTWVLLTHSYDGTTHKFYCNGVLAGSVVQPMVWVSSFVDFLYGQGGIPQKRTTGKFLKVYNYALSQEQVEQKYNLIASALDLRVANDNLLPDNTTKTAGQVITL